jgi:prolipoprotein diacylglyceryltransferase
MTFTVLGLTGSWYGLALGLSVLLYLCTAGVLGYVRRLPAGTVRLFGLLGLPLGLVFGRLVFCAVNWAYFTETISQPALMFAFWDGGFSLLGALCGLIAAAFLASRLMRVRFGTLMDVTAAPLGLLLMGFRLAEGFTGQLGVGKQVEVGALADALPLLFLTDRMGTMTLYRLAVYRYEATAALLLLAFGLALFFARGPRRRARQGDAAMMVFSLFGACQVLLESLRDDGHMLLGFIRVQQLGAALIPVLALCVFAARYAHIRQVRGTVVAAWLLLPVMAVVALLMVHPLNHVLDLTGRRTLGFAVLGVLAVYMALFLRVHGGSLRLVVTWLVALAAIAGCVMVEFSIDGSSNLLRDYALMATCCLALFLSPYSLWRTLRAEVYREDSISVRIMDKG